MREATIDTAEKHLEERAARSLPMGAGCAIAVGALFMGLGLVFAVALLLVWRFRTNSDEPILIYLVPALVVVVGGFAFVFSGGRTRARNAAARERAPLHPDEPWYGDWNWDPAGTVEEPLGLMGLLFAFLLFGVCVVFTYFVPSVLKSDVPFVAKAFMVVIVGVWDIVLLRVSYALLKTALRRALDGPARLRFETFPFFLGRSLAGRVSAKALAGSSPVVVTLRCLEERLTRTGARRNRSTTVEVFQRYEARLQVEGRVGGDRELSIAFPLPEGDYATRLGQQPPRYWELELKTSDDDDENLRFLVPVYARPSA